MFEYSMVHGNYEPNVLLSSLQYAAATSCGNAHTKGWDDHGYYKKNGRVSRER